MKLSPFSALFLVSLIVACYWVRCTTGVSPNYSQKTLDTNLGEAVADSRTDMVEYWLSEGADANANAPKIKDSSTEMDGQPMVLAAAQEHDVGSLKTLLDHGANVNAHWITPHTCHCDSGERTLETPLSAAASTVDVDEVRLLLERGADVHVVPGGKNGKTLLGYVRSEYPKQFNYLPGDVGGGRLPDDANVQGRYKQVVGLIIEALHKKRIKD